MNKEEKIEHLKRAIQRQLNYINFTTYGSAKVPLAFKLSNGYEKSAFNVVNVDTLEEAENIISILGGSETIIDETTSNKPLYLSVVLNLPR